MKPRGNRVRTLLVALVLAASIPSLCFTGVTVLLMQRMQTEQQEATLIGDARARALSVDRMFERLEDGLQALGSSNALIQGDMAAFTGEMRALSGRLGDLPIILAAPDGTVAAHVPETAPPPERALIRALGLPAIQARAPGVGNLSAFGDTPPRQIAVAVPVVRHAGGAPSYVLIGRIDSARLIESAESQPLRPDGPVITIRDRNGVTVARSLDPDQHIGEPSSPRFLAAITGRAFGPLPDDATSDGVPAIRAFSIAPVSGYIVTAVQPLGPFGATVRPGLVRTIIIAALTLTIGLSAAAYLTHRLVQGLRAIDHAGPAAAPSGVREVDELGARLHVAWQAREAVETSLRESESRLRDLVGMLDLAAIMVREIDGTIRFWSQGCARLYGWSREQAVGGSTHELLHTQFPEPLSRIEETLFRVGEWNGDLVQQRQDGSRLIAAAHKVLKRDLDGRPVMVMECLVDVTALRAAQDNLRDLNRGLEQRVRSEVAAREAAQLRAAHADRIQALGQLAGGISHDFNNVLQIVAGCAAVLARRPDDADAVVRLVRIISDAANRGASITRRMLLLGRRGDLKAEPVEAASLLDGMREVFAHTLGAGIEVRVQVAAELPWIMADKAQLETSLVNLATNARDAMPEGGVLRLTAGLEVVPAGDTQPHQAGLASGTYVRLSVVDNGTGMTAATLARVAEPFFTTKDVGKGTGLGLSMVKAFADQSGGALGIESTPGVGTKATLWLPRVTGLVRALPANAQAVEAPGITGRILLVDDDALVRDTVTDQLEALGHEVLAASCGTDALAILRARDAVDLMITDLSMPGMDGLTLIQEAREIRPCLPAILLTGYAGDADRLESDGAPRGSYTLMRKPATSSALNAQVTELLAG